MGRKSKVTSSSSYYPTQWSHWEWNEDNSRWLRYRLKAKDEYEYQYNAPMSTNASTDDATQAQDRGDHSDDLPDEPDRNYDAYENMSHTLYSADTVPVGRYNQSSSPPNYEDQVATDFQGLHVTSRSLYVPGTSHTNESTDPYSSPEVPSISTFSQTDNVAPSQRYQKVYVATISWAHHNITCENFDKSVGFEIPKHRQNENFSPPPVELPQNMFYYEGSATIPKKRDGGNHSGLRYDLDNELTQVRRIFQYDYEFDVTRIVINNAKKEMEYNYEKRLETDLKKFYHKIQQEGKTPSLAIIWYGGHGAYDHEQDVFRFQSGSFRPRGSTESVSNVQLKWSSVWLRLWAAENTIDRDLDHLFVMDCCHAAATTIPVASLSPPDLPSTTSYIFWLAALTEETSKSGPFSFTRIALHALRQQVLNTRDMGAQSPARDFTITDLWRLVEEAVHFRFCNPRPEIEYFGRPIDGNPVRYLYTPDR